MPKRTDLIIYLLPESRRALGSIVDGRKIACLEVSIFHDVDAVYSTGLFLLLIYCISNSTPSNLTRCPVWKVALNMVEQPGLCNCNCGGHSPGDNLAI